MAYFVMRVDAADGETMAARIAKDRSELVSGLDVHTIALRIGVPEISMTRLVEELSKRRWIEKLPGKEGTLFKLGEIKDLDARWFLDELTNGVVDETPKEMKASEVIMKKLEEDRRRVAAKEGTKVSEALKEVLTRGVAAPIAKAVTKIKPKDILLTFSAEYLKMYGVKPPLIVDGRTTNEYATTYVYISRAVKWSKSAKEVMDVVKFMFANWSKIRDGLGLDGRPSFNMLGSSKLWPRIVCCMTEGIPERRTGSTGKDVAKRFDKTEEGKPVGW